MTTESVVIGNHRLNIAITVLGMLVVICGNLIPDLTMQKTYYLSGGLLLLVSALLERQTFFIILQSIISVGTLVAFAPLSPALKAAVPLALSIAAIIYFAKQGWLKDGLTVLGCVGLMMLATGYSITHPLVYLLGASALTIYSFGAYRRGVAIGLMWGILNSMFVATAGIALYRL